jgi:trimeric autotransporter adhesin
MRSAIRLLGNGVLVSWSLLAVVWLAGCNDSKGGTSNPAPTVTSLSPMSSTAAGAAFTLTVNGTNFLPRSIVSWNGSARLTTFLSTTQLTAAIAAADIATAGTAQVTVTNPAPGGGISSALSFTVTATNNPSPTITSLSPNSATPGGAAFTMNVNGTNFISNSVVNWNGSARTTTFVSTTQISAAITATDIVASGTAQVTVTNPAPGGGTSPPTVFDTNPVANPVPAVSNVLPTSATAGGAAFTLTVNGSNFIATSAVQWNGAAQPTAFVDSTQVTAQIAASNIATAGTASVAVKNPAPGGGISNATPFTISSATQTVGIVQQLSTARNGNTGNGQSLNPAISMDGTYVDFTSNATNLITADTNGNLNDVFSRITCLQPGAANSCAPSTTVDALTNSGSQLANGSSSSESGAFMSGDGRFVVFEGTLGDVVSGSSLGPNTNEVYLRDTCRGQPSGCTPTTLLVSLTATAQPVDEANAGAVSGNGRVVVFFSASSTVVPGVSGGAQLYARDTCFGASGSCTPSTFLVSANNNGNKGNSTNTTVGPSLSDDGRYVAFYSDSTNLVVNDTNNRLDVFIRDTCVGAPSGCTPQTILVSANTSGGVATGGSNGSYVASLSGSGRFVMFQSDATDLVSTTNNGVIQIYLRDTCIGVTSGCTPKTTLITEDSNGHALASASTLFGQGSISSTGRYLLIGPGSPLNSGDLNGQAYVIDTCFGMSSGCTPQNHLISVDGQGKQFADGVRPMALSGDGRFAVLFDGTAQLYLALTGF